MNNDYDFLYKLLLIGDSGVGKSSLILRYVDDIFHDYLWSTLNFDLKFHTVEVDGNTIKLQIWNGRKEVERFDKYSSSYRGVHGFVIVYDVTNAESFNDVKYWFNEITKYAHENVIKLLVGNKSDLDSKRAVTFEEGQEFARLLGIEYIETSAKNSTNVDEAYLMLISQIKERMKCEAVSEGYRGVKLTVPSERKQDNGGGCF